jgi:acyl carrier protein
MPIVIDRRTPESLTAWLSDWLAGEVSINRASVDVHKPFLSYGLNSVQAMMLAGDLEVGLKREFPPTLAWDYPSIAALADYLFSLDAGSPRTEPAAAAGIPDALRHDAPPAIAPILDPVERDALLSRIDQLSEKQVDELLQRYVK